MLAFVDAWQVLSALRIDIVAHVPAQDLTGVLSLYGNAGRRGSRKPQLVESGPGLMRLNFSKAWQLTQSSLTIPVAPHLRLRILVRSWSTALVRATGGNRDEFPPKRRDLKAVFK